MSPKTARAHSAKPALTQSVLGIALLPALSSFATAAQDSLLDYITGLCFLIGILVWVGLALWGIGQIIEKSDIRFAWGAGCGLLILLVGWWAIPIILGLGPVWLIIGAMLVAKRSCPLCTVKISVNAIVCPNCHRDLPQNWSGALKPTSKRR